MRIISGNLKGRRISAPKNLPVRPTTDMAKEALFNILDNRYYLDELKVLDLFAGTGNISYEFASRGCDDITAVDQHYACVRFINTTGESLGLSINAIKADVFEFISNNKTQYDIVFADPPYDMAQSEFEKLIGMIMENELVRSEGICVIEHSKHTDLSQVKGFQQQKKYGGNCFSFFQ